MFFDKQFMIVKNYTLAGLIILFSICIFVNSADAEKESNRFEWAKASPERQGMSTEKLEEMRLLLERRGTKALLVIRNDHIVLEWYANGMNRTKKHYTASLAKALVGGMSLLIVLNDGRIWIDDPAYKYIPQWKDDKLKSKITIRMLATHSSGIPHAAQDGVPHNKLSGWKGQFWRREPDPFTIVRDQAPVIFSPGTDYTYSGPGFAMLGYAVTASLKDTPQSDIYTLLKERIMDPIGVPDDEWTISYGNTVYDIDGMKLYAIWGGGNYSIDAVARVGRLMLHKGKWKGRQLIEQHWVEKMVSDTNTPNPNSGLCWRTNLGGKHPSLPEDAFFGAGAGHQVLLVVPSLDLIVVRFGSSLYNRENSLWGLFKWYVLNPIIGSEEKHGVLGGLEKYIFNPIMTSIER